MCHPQPSTTWRMKILVTFVTNADTMGQGVPVRDAGVRKDVCTIAQFGLRTWDRFHVPLHVAWSKRSRREERIRERRETQRKNRTFQNAFIVMKKDFFIFLSRVNPGWETSNESGKTVERGKEVKLRKSVTTNFRVLPVPVGVGSTVNEWCFGHHCLYSWVLTSVSKTSWVEKGRRVHSQPEMDRWEEVEGALEAETECDVLEDFSVWLEIIRRQEMSQEGESHG